MRAKASRLFHTDKITRVLAAITFLFFLATAFRAGWQRSETDFPNYYTAAVLVRKGEPLRKFYDWTWFAREMGKAGFDSNVGSYTPQTPLTMLPMVGFAGLPAQRAKQVWLICNLLFLAGTLWMLSRISGRPVEQLWLFTFCGYYSLYTNFLLGQYYVFLLFLLTSILFLLRQERPWSSGLTAGATFALKLYGGPYLVYFIATRKWKSLAGMITAMACAGVLTISLFGFADVRYYLAFMLPRSLEGGAVDPFNPHNQTFTTLLRIIFLPEPQLNPHPLWNSPALFFFLRACFNLSILLLLYLGAKKSADVARDFAWYSIAILLLSTNVSSYTFIVMLLPFALLLEGCGPLQTAYLAASCFLLTLPVHLAQFFPKVWLLLGLFVFFGRDRWKKLSLKAFAAGMVAVVACSAFIAARQLRSYQEEPAHHAQQISTGTASLFSSFPVITSRGLFFQTMGGDGYLVRWLHDGRADDIKVDGNALRPIPQPNNSIAFEHQYRGVSTILRFDPDTGKLTATALPVPADDITSATSPNGKWLAYTSYEAPARHLWLRNLESAQAVRLAGGNCDSSWPTWDLDSRSVVFASDCGRAPGLPVLYRIQIEK